MTLKEARTFLVILSLLLAWERGSAAIRAVPMFWDMFTMDIGMLCWLYIAWAFYKKPWRIELNMTLREINQHLDEVRAREQD